MEDRPIAPIPEFLVRGLQGRITDQEELALRGWRLERPQNEELYQEFCAIWRITAGSEQAAQSPPPEGVELRRKARRKRREAVSARRIRRVATLTAIASFVAALAVGFFIILQRNGSEEPSVARFTEIITGPGERTTLTLWDGTSVRVGPNTTIRVSAEGSDVVAWLEGRAFFGVDPGSPHRFVVRTPHGEAAALGTRFEVQTENRELAVLVVEGSVRVRSGGMAIDLQEGLLSRSSDRGPSTTSRAENVYERLDWMGFALLFRETPLRRATAEIEHRYGVSVELDDAALGSWPVTATTTDQPVEVVMAVLCDIVGVECTERDGRFRIHGRNPASGALAEGR